MPILDPRSSRKQADARARALADRIWLPMSALRDAARLGCVDSAQRAIDAMPASARIAPDHRTLIEACLNPASTPILLMALDAFDWSPETLITDQAPARDGAFRVSPSLTTPLMVALSAGCWESALALSERAKKPLDPGAASLGAIARCAIGAARRPEGAQSALSRLLELGANPSGAPGYGQWEGANALHISAELGSTAISLFLPLGIDLNAKDGRFQTPFDAAIRAPNPSACMALLNAGVNPLDVSAPLGITPLHLLCDAIASANPSEMAARAPDFAPLFERLFQAGFSMTQSYTRLSSPITPRELLGKMGPPGKAFAERFEINMALGERSQPRRAPKTL